ncbi:hypothetical protein DFH07DRAFT_775884 [Mycena maculata]|uniref:Uncharacterized protein n=1 Tax=Mycena maculata TaxID=230809 RepID=A0AAD7IPR7_9AGAR|nr:hypothetical protein DFH07DRAFT_775884 [Mycena maculata]
MAAVLLESSLPPLLVVLRPRALLLHHVPYPHTPCHWSRTALRGKRPGPAGFMRRVNSGTLFSNELQRRYADQNLVSAGETSRPSCRAIFRVSCGSSPFPPSQKHGYASPVILAPRQPTQKLKMPTSWSVWARLSPAASGTPSLVAVSKSKPAFSIQSRIGANWLDFRGN